MPLGFRPLSSAEVVVDAGAFWMGVGEVLEVGEGTVDIWKVLGVSLLIDVAILGGFEEGSVSCAKEVEERIADRKSSAGERWRDREQRQLVLLPEATMV